MVNGWHAEAGIARGSNSRTATSPAVDAALPQLHPRSAIMHALCTLHCPTTPVEHQSRTLVLVRISEFFVFLFRDFTIPDM